MTQEDKQLLLADLCARLPYGVFVRIEVDGHVADKKLTVDFFSSLSYHVECVKPYLRPISSFKEEEMDKLFEILDIDGDGNNGNEWIKINDIGILRLFTRTGRDFEDIAKALDYLHSIHIDYRCLIEEGLALEAPEGMYNV